MDLRKNISVAVFVAMIIVTHASACNNASLNGTFGYFHGRPGGGGPTPVVAVLGLFTANGSGAILGGKYTLDTGGSVTNGTFTGSYAIAANCTGSLTFSAEDNGSSPSNFDIVLDSTQQGFQMIQSDAGFDSPGFGIPRAVSCTTFNKTLAVNVVGTTDLAMMTPDQVAIVGRLKFVGTVVTGGELQSVNFANSPVAVTGTDTVIGDCTGTVTITGGPLGTTHFNTVLVTAKGTELLMLETDANTLVGGIAIQ